EHHMMRCALDDHFELYEFPNDLARWCWDALGDEELGEQLGLIDPYQYPSLASLRTILANVIEERLWGLERVSWSPAALALRAIDFYFLSLNQLRSEIIEIFRQASPDPEALAKLTIA